MMAGKKKFFDWNSMDQAQKLGWIWLGLFWTLILATAGAILYPAYKKWQAENQEEPKSGYVLPAEINLAANPPVGGCDGMAGAYRVAGEARRFSDPTRIG